MNEILERLTEMLEARKAADPQSSYVAKLYHKGVDGIAKKIGEEAAEVIIAAKNPDDDSLVYEAADLLFHTLVLLAHRDLSYQDVLNELARREGLSGLVEKASRPS